MGRFRKLLFVALMLTVLVVSEAIAAALTCTTQIEVPALILNVSSKALNDIGINYTGGPATVSFAVLFNAPLLNVPALQAFNGSASTPTTTVQGQMAEGYDNKAAIWLNVPITSVEGRILIKNPQVNVQAFSQGDAIASRIFYLDSAPGSSVFQSPWINKGVLVSDINTCASFASTMPNNGLSLFIRYIPVSGNFYNALLTSPDGSNKFSLTAAEGVNAGNCTNAATLTIGQNEDDIHINDINYNGDAFDADVRYYEINHNFTLVTAAPIPKAALSVSPSSFTITHSWSAPYSTSCPQLIGTLHIMNTGETGSDLSYSVHLGPLTLTPDSATGFILGGGVESADVRLYFNCDVSGPGTYIDIIDIYPKDSQRHVDLPPQAVSVTIVVTP